MTESAGEMTAFQKENTPTETDGLRGTPAIGSETTRSGIKCVVWDLDNTLWEGVLLEGDPVCLRQTVLEIVRTLDGRGILQSIASKNNHVQAMAKLDELGVRDFFLYPQINWNSKASSIEKIARSLKISLESMIFIDDQPFEREEVSFSLPQILCLDVSALDGLCDMPQMNPRFITADSRNRRRMYLSDIERNELEDDFVGPQEEFLASLQMVMSIAPAREEDLVRAEELTLRTNQLNTTGRTFTYDELDYFRQSNQHRLWIAGLEDKFGSYGKIGLALVEYSEQYWTIKLLLMSCRVISRGVGGLLLSHIMQTAREAGVGLRADFVPNERNRMMYVTYRFAGFRETQQTTSGGLLANDLSLIQPFPDYIKVQIAD